MSIDLEIEAAPAKINLFFHVTGRAPTGEIDFESLAAFSHDICDKIYYADGKNDLIFKVIGPHARRVPHNANNSVLRALNLFSDTLDTPIKGSLVLEKKLPVGAGLNGKAANSAACLRLLGRLHGHPAHTPVLHTIAEKMGHNVPPCLTSTPVHLRSHDNHSEKLPNWPPLPILLISPPQTLKTTALLQAIDIPFATPMVTSRIPPHDPQDYIEWLWQFVNNLEGTARRMEPDLNLIVRHFINLAGCRLARMAGNGTCFFGLFETLSHAQKAAEYTQKKHPEWWVQSGWVNNP